ncbi:unnamed protein product, partial [Discosporangium mesarthrocarpum]
KVRLKTNSPGGGRVSLGGGALLPGSAAAGFSAAAAAAAAAAGEGRTGIVRFIGCTQFASGRWVGLELADGTGKNDGSVNGVEYFRCPPDHGVFVRPDMVERESGGGGNDDVDGSDGPAAV